MRGAHSRKRRVEGQALLLLIGVICLFFTSGTLGATESPTAPAPAGAIEAAKGGMHTTQEAVARSDGDCFTQRYAGTPDYQWSLPSGYTTAFAMRFDAFGDADTLTAVEFFAYDPGDGSFGDDSFFVDVYADDGFGLPGTELASLAVPPGAYVAYPETTYVDFSALNLVFNSDFYVGISCSADTNSGEGEAILSDDGSMGTNRSSYLYQDEWYSFADPDYNFCIFVTTCHTWFEYAQISGHKYRDEDNSKTVTTGDLGLGNWRIELWQKGVLKDYDYTLSGTGIYTFHSVGPGTYQIAEVPSPDLAQILPGTVVGTVNVMNGGFYSGPDFLNDSCDEYYDYYIVEDCLHGTDDNFGGPETGFMSPDLESYLIANAPFQWYTDEFDQPLDNYWFGHTFHNCWDDRCIVYGATLRLRLHASGDIPHTDWLVLGDYSQDGRIWSVSLNTLEQYAGGTPPWSYCDTLDVTLDLANLSPLGGSWPSTNILGALQDGTLDIIISDDTEVDLIEITVDLCCPDTLASIAGTKFEDINGNSIWDLGLPEPVLQNFEIELTGTDINGPVLQTDFTDVQGNYLFDNLLPGSYQVKEKLTGIYSNFTQTFPLTVFHTVNSLQAGDHLTGLDFGNDTCDIIYQGTHSTITCLHGTDDNFGGPEAGNLSPAFESYLYNTAPFHWYTDQFDQPLDNYWFGHTFDKCWDDECEVYGATLRLRLHASGSQPETDNLTLGDYSQDGRIWSISMNDLEQYAGGTPPWSYCDTIDVTLDLANLPIPSGSWLPTNILAALQDGDLDIRITDDTEVDLIEITVDLCCPDSCVNVAGTKFEDVNGNSFWDKALPEGVLANFEIELTGTDIYGPITPQTDFTDAQGEYSFEDLLPGSYQVKEKLSGSYWNWTQTYPATVFYTLNNLQEGAYMSGLDFGNDTCDIIYQGLHSQVTCLHGTDDNFVGPESGNLSPALDQYLYNTAYNHWYTDEFDRPLENWWFGHTFEDCWDDECEVYGATLRLKLHASGIIPSTDFLALGDYSQDGRIWSISMPNLNEQYGSGTPEWNYCDTMDVTLDLANLWIPGGSWLPTNILAALQDGDLDIIISDDTEVDLIEITVDLCCPDSCDCTPGDADGNDIINIADAVYLISYIFGGGPTPTPYPICSGDADCNCIVNIADAVHLISYIFGGGPAPCPCEQWLTACGPPLR